jgi:hypothetical protein
MLVQNFAVLRASIPLLRNSMKAASEVGGAATPVFGKLD